MSIDLVETPRHPPLGEAQLRYQTARLRQIHLQFGKRTPLHLDSILERMARLSRDARVPCNLAESIGRTSGE